MESYKNHSKASRIFFPLNYLYYYRYEILIGTVLGLFLSGIYIFVQNYSFSLTSPEALKELIESFRGAGVFVFIGLVLLQVVVFFIPGEFLQAAGGYIYGVVLGSIVSTVGILLGSIIVFFLARKLGVPFLRAIISEKKLEQFRSLLSKGEEPSNRQCRRIRLLVFFIYFIPGFPKDAIAYIAGITDLKFRDFILASMIGRMPSIVISASFGAGIYRGNKHLLVFIALSIIILCYFGTVKGKDFLKDFKVEE